MKHYIRKYYQDSSINDRPDIKDRCGLTLSTFRAIFAAGWIVLAALCVAAQNDSPFSALETLPAVTENNDSGAAADGLPLSRKLRVETLPISGGGGELITIFARINNFNVSGEERVDEVPMISVLRDTLGDQVVENDRLRYFWVLSHADPSFAQKFAASIPFVYSRTTNKASIGNSPPKPVADINPLSKGIWDKVFFTALKRIIIDDLSYSLRVSGYQYRKNTRDYRQSSIAQALALLSVFQAVEGQKILSETEMLDIRSRLILRGNDLSPFFQSENLGRLNESSMKKTHAVRGVNWEILRQLCEAQNLYFQPLEMPGGGATHALVWVDEADVAENRQRKFDSRILNIKSPWNDSRLTKWDGYSETRWYDEENRVVEPNTPNARPKKMIPLALYGLDFPKIPVLLVDFRDSSNPKKREMSKRILDDLTKNVLSVSVFKNPGVFLGRFIFDFVVRRKGIDINQDSRVTSYSQLKLLVLLNESLDPDFRDEIADRVERVSLNPLQNDLEVEVKLARGQYANLVAYAKDPDGLAAQLNREREKEMVRLKHNGTERFFFSLARIFTFGQYEHREKSNPSLMAQMDFKRRLEYHERKLLEIARDTVKPEIDSDMASLMSSLQFIADSGKMSRSGTPAAIAKIFSNTENEQIRELSLLSLYRIDNPASIRQILALFKNETTEPDWRDVCATYLKRFVKENRRISPEVLKEINELTVD